MNGFKKYFGDYASKLIVIAGIVGAILFVRFYGDAYPQAGLSLDVSRNDAVRIAEQYVSGMGYDIKSYNSGAILTSDDLLASFLQRSWGLEKFGHEIRTRATISPWKYVVRFFKPLQQEEFDIEVTPHGEIRHFTHVIPEDASGKRLTETSARSFAVKFASDILKSDLSEYEEKPASLNVLENRTDYTFDFEKKNSGIIFESDGQKHRGHEGLLIVVAGNEIGEFFKYVSVPESYSRMETTVNSYGDLFSLIATVFEVIIFIAALVVLLRRYKKDDLRPFHFVWLVVALVAIQIVQVAISPDTFALMYDTALPWLNYLASSWFFSILFIILFTAIPVLVMGTAGECVTREVLPASNDFDPNINHDKSYLWSVVVKGLFAGLAALGYVTIFYKIGFAYFGITTPAQFSSPEAYGSFMPFLYPVVLSLAAAFSEELEFRYFGISFVKKYVKNNFVAVLVPAVIWAFLHSTYPVYPMYMRGVELTVTGLLFGFVFVRYGIVSSIVAHYVYNAVLISAPLILSGNFYFYASGVVAILLVFALPVMYPIFNGIISKRRGIMTE